jgi:pilus assembly protein CpaE
MKVISVGSSPAFYREVTEALRARPEDINWVQSAESFGPRFRELRGPTELVVISPEVDHHRALEIARTVNTSAPATATVLVRTSPLKGSMQDAMRAGVRDVVDLSDQSHSLRSSLQQAMAWSNTVRSATNGHEAQCGRVISVFSSKGGAGKTFLASNLAVAASQMLDHEVALVDLELGMGDVFSYFGMEPQRSFQDLLALGSDADREAIHKIGSHLGNNLVGFGSAPDPTTHQPASDSVSSSLQSLREIFGHVILDMSPDYSDMCLVALESSDLICLITQLDVVGVKHLAKALETLSSIGVPHEKFRIVLNRADSKVGIEASDVEKVLKIKVDALVPSSRLVPASLNNGRPVLLAEPRSDVARSISSFAEQLFGEFATKRHGAKRHRFRRG